MKKKLFVILATVGLTITGCSPTVVEAATYSANAPSGVDKVDSRYSVDNGVITIITTFESSGVGYDVIITEYRTGSLQSQLSDLYRRSIDMYNAR